MYCDVISCALHHAHTYPVATQKRFMLKSITMHVQMYVHTGIKFFSLRSYRYVTNYCNKATCMHSMHDDQEH